MKRQLFELMKAKVSTKKEINLSFTQCQDKNSSSKKTNKENEELKENPNNQSLGQIEISFWKKSLTQLEEQYESLKSFELFKEKQLSLLKYELNSNTNEDIEKKKKENELKLKEIKKKFSLEESKLNNELSGLKQLQNEYMEFT